jgi:hypothetical protein
MVFCILLYPTILIQEFGEHAALLLELRWQVTRLSKAQGFLMELDQFLICDGCKHVFLSMAVEWGVPLHTHVQRN